MLAQKRTELSVRRIHFMNEKLLLTCFIRSAIEPMIF
jgi:hypothetical protein